MLGLLFLVRLFDFHSVIFHFSLYSVIHYDVIVHTGNVWNGATLGTVILEVHGDRGDTGKRILRHGNHGVPFARGQVDIFPLECVSLGDIRFIKLKHDPGMSGLPPLIFNDIDLH